MHSVDEALTQFCAGALDEDELRTVVLTAVRNGPRAEVESIIHQAAHTSTLQDVCARLLKEIVQTSPQSEATSPPLTHEGKVVRNRFVLEKEIGRGGMGVVYQARDLRRVEADDRHSHVAIKVMNQALQHHPDALITLQREARRAQQLAHPNIATVFDFDREGDIAYLCMELLDGEPLNTVLKEDTERSLESSLSIIRGICDGLAYAHKSGIVHADLKPGNIFLTRNNVVKILDFGLARTVRAPDDSSGVETSFDAGRWHAMTPAYASPEMFDRREPHPSDDIYGLACVSYELLCGRHPYSRLTAPRAMEEGLTVKPIPGLTRRQNKALKDALAFNREERTATVKDFLDGLMVPQQQSSTAIILAVGVTAVFSVLGIAWLYVNSLDPSRLPVDTSVIERQSRPNEPTPGNTPDRNETLTTIPLNQASDPGLNEQQQSPAQTPDETLDTENRERISRILEIADLHFAMRRFVTPSGSNAVEAYLAVTTLDPTNAHAVGGIDRVADAIIKEARGLAPTDRQGAVELLERALTHLPNMPDLRAAHHELLSTDKL